MASGSKGAKNAQTRYQGKTRSATPKKVRAANAVTPPLSEQDREYLNSSLADAQNRLGDTAAGANESAVFEALERFGLSSDRVQRLRESINRMNAGEAIEKAGEYLAEQIEGAREYSRENKGKVIGGAAGVLVGASLLAMALTRAAGDESKSVLGAAADGVKRRVRAARKPAKRSTATRGASTSRTRTATATGTGTRKSASTSAGSKRSAAAKKGAAKRSGSKATTSRSTSSRAGGASKAAGRKTAAGSTASTRGAKKSTARRTSSGGAKKARSTSRSR